jgi:tetratricopeptide (TPR) repeat protein
LQKRVNALLRAGKLRMARSVCARACRDRPKSAAAHNNLGVVTEALHDYATAERCYRRGIALRPADDRLHINLGNVCILQHDLDGAEAAYREALRLNPAAVDALNNLGIIRQYRYRFRAAAECFRRAATLDPAFPVAPTNLANLSREKRRFPAALAAYRRVLRRFPRYGPAHLGLGVLHLQQGDYERGWPEYEWRFWSEDMRRRSSPGRDWDGANLSGRCLLVRAEQAIGDQVMFASIVPDALRDAGHVIVECDDRLVPLFARSFPAADVVADPYAASARHSNTPRPDVRAWFGTLALHYRRSAAMFPRHEGFLVASPTLVMKWRRRLAALGPGLKVGISWKGGAEPYSQALRSIPLAEWSPILATPGVTFVNLQYGTSRADLRTVAPVRILDWPDADPLRDLDNFAAQIAALDLVISIDNSTVHVAGALGKRVWTMLPYSATWRWPPGRTDSVWYPSMRVFQQPGPGDWAPVLHAVALELSRLPGAGTGGVGTAHTRA